MGTFSPAARDREHIERGEMPRSFLFARKILTAPAARRNGIHRTGAREFPVLISLARRRARSHIDRTGTPPRRSQDASRRIRRAPGSGRGDGSPGQQPARGSQWSDGGRRSKNAGSNLQRRARMKRTRKRETRAEFPSSLAPLVGRAGREEEGGRPTTGRGSAL